MQGKGFSSGSARKESTCNAGDLGLIPGLRRSLGRERLPAPVFWPGEFCGLYGQWGHKESDTTERPSRHMQGEGRKAALSTSIILIKRGIPSQNPSASFHHIGHIFTTWHTCGGFILIFGKTNTIM